MSTEVYRLGKSYSSSVVGSTCGYCKLELKDYSREGYVYYVRELGEGEKFYHSYCYQAPKALKVTELVILGE